MTERFGIAEWFGEPFIGMTSTRRRELAVEAQKPQPSPVCPFRGDGKPCTKRGGVCSRRFYRVEGDRVGGPTGPPVALCPTRFNQDNVVHKWLAEIVGFKDAYLAPEVPFMKSRLTGSAAGRIDLVLSQDDEATDWYGLEIQSVYFSGEGMGSEFRLLEEDTGQAPPAPSTLRRPDWRSSSAKRLMPQLLVKVPTLRR